MAKIINIEKNYEIGKILAQIKKSEDAKIMLQISSDSNFLNENQDLALVQSYAKSNGKAVAIQDTKRFEKLGFIAGKDVSEIQINKHKNTIDKNSKINRKPQNKMKIPSLKINKIVLSVSIIIAFLVISSALVFAGYYYLPTANVELKIESQVFTGTKDVTANLSSETPDVENRIIPATTISATVKDSLVELATGEKETGNKAKSKVEFLNKTDEKITIKPENIIEIELESGDKIDFEVIDEIEIPKKETEEVTNSEGETKKAEVYGSKEEEIIATSFGEEYNFDKKDVKQIKIEGIDADDLEAEIKDDSSGGSTKKVTVVTEKDQEALLEKLEKNLHKKSLEVLKSKTVSGQELLEDSVLYTTSSKVFDTNIDEEAEKFELNYVGGLVTHVVEMLKFAESSKSVYKNINFSELAFGVIFHDIGKVHELALNGVVLERTLAGYLVGHLGQGLMLVNNFFPKDFDEDKKNRLLHMLISHHGEREKGSPVQPMTLEAIILSEIDNLSFKAGTYFTHLEGSEVNDKGLTGYSKYLGTSILPS